MTTPPKKRSLTKRQRRALRSLVATEDYTPHDIRAHLHAKPGILYRWLQDENFCAELDRRLSVCRRISALLVNSSLPNIITRISALCDGYESEIARKACQDFLKIMADVEKNEAFKISPRPRKNEPAPETANATSNQTANCSGEKTSLS